MAQWNKRFAITTKDKVSVITKLVTTQRKINCTESIQIKANIFPPFVKGGRGIRC